MSNNFLQFNPGAANQETDATYSTDTLRTGGFANPSIVPSALLNKVLFQASTFIAAFAQALATKGYSVTDASLANLAATLANVMTLADMAGYAPLANPHLTGVPTAPTAASSDSSTTLATTAYVKSQGYAPLASPTLTGTPTAPTPAASDSSTEIATTAFVKNQNYQPSLGFTPIQQGGGSYQAADKIYLGWDGAGLRAQVDNSDLGRLTTLSQFTGALNGSSGWSRMPNGQLLQWGAGGTAPSYTTPSLINISFPVAFSAPPAVFVQNSNGGQANDFTTYNVPGSTTTYFPIAASANGIHGFWWFAIGN